MPRRSEAEPNWYSVACAILINCRGVASRVSAQGVTLYLTDTDNEIVRGFEIVYKNSSETEFLALCAAAGLSSKYIELLTELYFYRKGVGGQELGVGGMQD